MISPICFHDLQFHEFFSVWAVEKENQLRKIRGKNWGKQDSWFGGLMSRTSHIPFNSSGYGFTNSEIPRFVSAYFFNLWTYQNGYSKSEQKKMNPLFFWLVLIWELVVVETISWTTHISGGFFTTSQTDRHIKKFVKESQ